MHRKTYFSPNPLQCTENLTLVPVNFNAPKSLPQSPSASMCRKLDFSSNKLQSAEEISSVPFHVNVPKTRLQSQ